MFFLNSYLFKKNIIFYFLIEKFTRYIASLVCSLFLDDFSTAVSIIGR